MQYESGYYNDPAAAYGQAYDPTGYAQTQYGQEAYTQASYAQGPYGQDPYGQDQYGQALYGQDQYGQAPVAVGTVEAQPSGRGVWLTTMGLCVAMLLLIGFTLSAMAYLDTTEDAPSTPEEIEFPVLSGSPSSGKVVPVPIAKPSNTSTIPEPVSTTAPVTPTMGPTAPTMRPTAATMQPTAPTAPTARPAEPPTAPTTMPTTAPKIPLTAPKMPLTAPTMRPTAPTMRPTAPTARPPEPPTARPAEPSAAPTMRRPTAPKVPPTAPKMPPTAPKVPPTAPKMPPTAPKMPPTAPKAPPTAPKMPPVAPPRPPTAPTVPPAAPKATSTESSDVVVITEEAIDKQPMACTMGDRITSGLQFPPDGLCDFIFYDSLYKGGSNLLPKPATYSKSLNIFLNEHPAYRSTTLGVGLAFKYLAIAGEDLNVTKPSPLEPFWKKGVFHVGILDTPSTAARSHTKAAISTMEAINKLLETQRARGKFSITAMSTPNTDPDWSLAFARDFKNLRFTPFLFITFGHYRFGDNMVPHCAIMPPTRHPDDTPPEDIAKDYNFDLAAAVLSLSDLYASRANTRGLVSVTLKGRWTKPLFPDIVDFFKRCASDPDIVPFGSYTEVCPGGGSGFGAQLSYSKKHYAVITYIDSLKRAFVYDDEKAFATKLCYTRSLESNIRFGVAVYDIDYDDYENECGSLNIYKHYSRLKAVKKVVESFRRQNASFKEDVCRKYAVP